MEPYDKLSTSLGKLQSDVKTDLLSAGYFTGFIIGVIGLILLLIELNMINKIRQINTWPIIKNGGTIRDSYMENSSSNTNYSILVVSESYYSLIYRTRASFIYQINGKKNISNKISYYEPWESNPMIAKIENDTLKKGSTVNIRVNPKNVSEAYIYNKPYNRYVRLAIASILTLIGIYALVKLWKQSITKK